MHLCCDTTRKRKNWDLGATGTGLLGHVWPVHFESTWPRPFLSFHDPLFSLWCVLHVSEILCFLQSLEPKHSAQQLNAPADSNCERASCPEITITAYMNAKKNSPLFPTTIKKSWLPGMFPCILADPYSFVKPVSFSHTWRARLLIL